MFSLTIGLETCVDVFVMDVSAKTTDVTIVTAVSMQPSNMTMLSVVITKEYSPEAEQNSRKWSKYFFEKFPGSYLRNRSVTHKFVTNRLHLIQSK